MEVIIREAKPEDAPQLLTYMDLLLSEPGIDIPLERDEFRLSVEEEARILADHAASANSLFLVADSQRGIIGQLSLKGGNRRALRHSAALGMSVKKGWRNQGVGNALMRRAMDWVQEAGVIKRVELCVYVRNQPAIHLYEKHGFQVEGQRRNIVYQNGEYLDDLLMARLF